MSERFYLNWPLRPGPVDLAGPEAHHLATVCRLRPGDLLFLFNGDGQEYPARVLQVARRHVTLEILAANRPERELAFFLEVAAPLPKGDRAQFLVEKLTELGVTSFVPLATRRSVIHPREGKLDKLQRYVIEASKQCGRNVLMQIQPLADWEIYCRREDLQGTKIVAHPEGSDFPLLPFSPPLTLVVGPEGGFTEEEIAAATGAGWQTLDLGPRILRVETAAVFMVAKAIAR